MQWELSVRHLFDWSKTFDGLNHELLIPKLRCHGLNQHPVECFRSYLSNCSQCCKINFLCLGWVIICLSVNFCVGFCVNFCEKFFHKSSNNFVTFFYAHYSLKTFLNMIACILLVSFLLPLCYINKRNWLHVFDRFDSLSRWLTLRISQDCVFKIILVKQINYLDRLLKWTR